MGELSFLAWFVPAMNMLYIFFQVEVLFELIKGLIKDLDGISMDEVCIIVFNCFAV